MYLFVYTWVFGFKVFRFLSQCIYVCTCVYILGFFGFMVFRFLSQCTYICTCLYILGFLVLRFSGFCLSVFMYVPVCIYLGFWF